MTKSRLGLEKASTPLKQEKDGFLFYRTVPSCAEVLASATQAPDRPRGGVFGLFPGMIYKKFQEYIISLKRKKKQHICKKRHLKRFLTIYKYFLIQGCNILRADKKSIKIQVRK